MYLLKLNALIRKKALIINSVTYGLFYTTAEFTRQSYTKMFKLGQTKPTNHESNQLKAMDANKPVFIYIKKFNETLGLSEQKYPTQGMEYNWPQLKRYGIYGCFIAGPALHGWYKWLDNFYQGRSMKIVLKKLFADQFILTPPLIILFFISMSLMEGKLDIFTECRIKFCSTFLTSCTFWLPVQFINFMLVSPGLRVLFVSVAAFCWVNILCYIKSISLAEYNSKTQ